MGERGQTFLEREAVVGSFETYSFLLRSTQRPIEKVRNSVSLMWCIFANFSRKSPKMQDWVARLLALVLTR